MIGLSYLLLEKLTLVTVKLFKVVTRGRLIVIEGPSNVKSSVKRLKLTILSIYLYLLKK